MNAKIKTRKLLLTSETLRMLAETDLRRVQGGGSGLNSCNCGGGATDDCSRQTATSR